MYAHYLHCPIPSHPIPSRTQFCLQLAASWQQKALRFIERQMSHFLCPFTYPLSTLPLPLPPVQRFHLSTASPLAELAANIAVLITCIKLLCLSLHHSGEKVCVCLALENFSLASEGGRWGKMGKPARKTPLNMQNKIAGK